MNQSRFNKLIVVLKRHEGVKNHVYTCSAGYETIGAGRNISPSGLGISESEIHMLLTNDIYRVIGELSEEYKWFDDLDNVRKDAMIDLSFNLGQTSLRKFENLTSLHQHEQVVELLQVLVFLENPVVSKRIAVWNGQAHTRFQEI